MQDTIARPTDITNTKIPGWKWAVVWLLFLATLINYMDRQTMGCTNKFVMAEFKLDDKGYGELESWFGIAFALLQFPAGILADRLSLRWLYAIALLIWSAAGFSTGLATTFAGLAACRLVLGIGESFNWPCAVAVIRRLLPRESRSMANGIFHAGASIGAAVTPTLVDTLAGEKGEHWRLVFQLTGAIGMIWAVAWFSFVRGPRAAEISYSAPSRDDDDSKSADGPSVPFLEIFKYRQFWITLVVGIAINITWHVYRVWLPRLLDNEKIGMGYTLHKSRQIQTGFYIFADAGCMAAGFITQYLARSGVAVVRSRKIVMIATSLLCLLSMWVPMTDNPYIFVPLVFLVGAGAMGGFANFYTLSQEISPRHTGKCLGLIGCIIWGVLSPLHTIIGKAVVDMHTYLPVFVAIAFIPLMGSVIALYWKDEPAKADSTIPAAVEG